MRKPRPILGGACLVVVSALLLAAGLVASMSQAAASTSTRQARPCADLARLSFTDGTRVTGAEQTAGPDPICHVDLLVPERINIAVSLPVGNWNGRFQGVGGGGYAGQVAPPDSAARAGYAAAATDTGHSASPADGSWAWSTEGMRQNLIEDFGFRSVHEMTVKGKAVTEAFYGRPPAFSYWNGCSTGGRQGLMEAQRFPHDYDGILSGAPAINWDRFIPSELWPQIVMREAGNVLAPCKFDAVNQAVLAACDVGDGVTDGIMDPTVCRFDPSVLVGEETGCGTITAADVAVVRKIWQGPRRADGSFLWYGLPPGAAFSGLAGSTADLQPAPFPIAEDWFTWWLAKEPGFDWRGVSTAGFADFFDQSRAEYHEVLGTDDPDLGAFRDSGGKLILWHGWADQLIFARGTVDYFQRVTREMGGPHRTERFARLFMAPGVAHCGGGTGAAPSDPIAALVTWVERGKAPGVLQGRGGDLTRPLCRWPSVPRYDGHGDTGDAASFRCAGGY